MVIYNLPAPKQNVKNRCDVSKDSGDKEEEDESAEEKCPYRNPITGEGLDNTSAPGHKQKEASTDFANEQDEVQKKPRRPCIRVRQPPGGKSSIIF